MVKGIMLPTTTVFGGRLIPVHGLYAKAYLMHVFQPNQGFTGQNGYDIFIAL